MPNQSHMACHDRVHEDQQQSVLNAVEFKCFCLMLTESSGDKRTSKIGAKQSWTRAAKNFALETVRQSLDAHVTAYLKVLGDHLQGDLKDSLKDLGHFHHHALLQLVDDGSKQAQHLSIPASGSVPPRLAYAALREQANC